MAVPWGPIIAAGASIAGSAINYASDQQAYAYNERWNKKALKESKRQFDISSTQSIQRRVADAKAAGLHPLYALGAASASPSGFSPSGAPSGSYVGEGIAQAGKAIGTAVDRRSPKLSAVEKAQVAELQSRTAVNLAEAQRIDSERKTNEGRANVHQDVWKVPPSGPHIHPSGVKTWGLGERKPAARPKKLPAKPVLRDSLGYPIWIPPHLRGFARMAEDQFGEGGDTLAYAHFLRTMARHEADWERVFMREGQRQKRRDIRRRKRYTRPRDRF